MTVFAYACYIRYALKAKQRNRTGEYPMSLKEKSSTAHDTAYRLIRNKWRYLPQTLLYQKSRQT